MQRIKNLIKSPADLQYNQMHKMFLHDRSDEAENEWVTLLKKYPSHTKTHFLLAQIARNERHYQRAREWYQKVLSYAPTNTKARLWRARSNFELYRFEDALDDYLTLYETSFANVDYLVSLGDCYQKLNLHLIALRYYTKAVKLDPKSIKAHLGLGYEYIIDGHYAQAAESVRKAKELYYANKYEYDTWVVDNIFDLEKHVKMVTGEGGETENKKKNKKIDIAK